MLWLLEFDGDEQISGIKSFNRWAHLDGPADKYSWGSSACWECSNRSIQDAWCVYFTCIFHCADRQSCLSVFQRSVGVIPYLWHNDPTHNALTDIFGRTGTFLSQKIWLFMIQGNIMIRYIQIVCLLLFAVRLKKEIVLTKSEVMRGVWKVQVTKSVSATVGLPAPCLFIYSTSYTCAFVWMWAVWRLHVWIWNLQGRHEEDTSVSCLLVSLSCSFLLNMLPIVKLEGFPHNRVRVEIALARL